MTDYDFGELSSGILGVFSLDDFYNGGATGDLIEQNFSSALVQPFTPYRLKFYAQDGWRVRRNIELTLTLRGTMRQTQFASTTASRVSCSPSPC